jgi:hypothetical protein
VAVVASSLLLLLMEQVKVRLQTHGAFYNGALDCVGKTVRVTRACVLCLDASAALTMR